MREGRRGRDNRRRNHPQLFERIDAPDPATGGVRQVAEDLADILPLPFKFPRAGRAGRLRRVERESVGREQVRDQPLERLLETDEGRINRPAWDGDPVEIPRPIGAFTLGEQMPIRAPLAPGRPLKQDAPEERRGPVGIVDHDLGTERRHEARIDGEARRAPLVLRQYDFHAGRLVQVRRVRRAVDGERPGHQRAPRTDSRLPMWSITASATVRPSTCMLTL